MHQRTAKDCCLSETFAKLRIALTSNSERPFFPYMLFLSGRGRESERARHWFAQENKYFFIMLVCHLEIVSAKLLSQGVVQVGKKFPKGIFGHG